MNKIFPRVIETSSNTPAATGTVSISLSGTSPTMTFIGAGTSAGRLFNDDFATGETCIVHIYQTNDPSLFCEAQVTFTDATPDTLTFVAADVLKGSAGAGTLVTFTSTVTCELNVSTEGLRRATQGYLEHASHDGTAAVTGVVGTMHVFTALTADRIFTLPATAQGGDRVGVTFPAGSASYEILLKSASGDKINNVDCSTTEWSRLFIAGEMVIFRCIDASTVDWVVEHNGLIPQQGLMRLSTQCDGESSATFTRPTAASSAGAWTADVDIGSICTVSTDRITVRRAGKYNVAYAGLIKDSVGDQAQHGAALFKNGTTDIIHAATMYASGTSPQSSAGSVLAFPLAVDDYVVYAYRTAAGSLGLTASAAPRIASGFSLVEVL